MFFFLVNFLFNFYILKAVGANPAQCMVWKCRSGEGGLQNCKEKKVEDLVTIRILLWTSKIKPKMDVLGKKLKKTKFWLISSFYILYSNSLNIYLAKLCYWATFPIIVELKGVKSIFHP